MALQCGIVGLPNVGKSTLFNCLTSAQVAADNYPFCTIEPNVGMVAVPDKRLQHIAELVKPKGEVIPAMVEFVDIAGLIEGAAQGEGLGNQFLAHIRETDAIIHMVRCFEDANIPHVDGQVDPAHDVAVINTELALADLSTLDQAMRRLEKAKKMSSAQAQWEGALLKKMLAHLNDNRPLRLLPRNPEEDRFIRSLHLLTNKPMLYVANTAELIGQEPFVQTVQRIAQAEQAQVVVMCASIEADIARLDEHEKKTFLEEFQLAEPGLDRLIRAGYRLLQLETYFTAGVQEVRAWTIRFGTTAPKAAAVIHTDFEAGFIRAEVVAYEDFIRYRGEQGARDAGRWRLEGKDYIVQDGDIIYFRINK